VGAVRRFFEELERTFRLLKELPPELPPLIEEGLAKKQAEVADWLAEAASKWKELPAEAKVAVRLEDLASRVSWRRSKYDEGEFVYVSEAPELKELLEKCENGKVETGGFAYYLRGDIIKRYPRGNRKAAQQQAAPQAPPQGGEGK
jgi:hypothetical protein